MNKILLCLTFIWLLPFQEKQEGVIDGLTLTRSEINRYFPFIHPYGDGSEYYYVDNICDGKAIIPKYKTFEDDSTKIIITYISKLFKKGNLDVLFANVMGGRLSLVLGILDSTGHKYIRYANMGPAIDTIIISNINGKTFYEITHLPAYAGMFGYANQAYSVYVDTSDYFGFAFYGYFFEDINEVNKQQYIKGNSYKQDLQLTLQNDDVIIRSKKLFLDSTAVDTTYVFRHFHF